MKNRNIKIKFDTEDMSSVINNTEYDIKNMSHTYSYYEVFQQIFKNNNTTAVLLFILYVYEWATKRNLEKNRNRWLYISKKALMRRTNLSNSAVTVSIQILVNSGILEKKLNKHKNKAYAFKLNIYLINELRDEYRNAISLLGYKTTSKKIQNECELIRHIQKEAKETRTSYYESYPITNRDKEYRELILKRDNYTCQHCGSRLNLEVHHKYPAALYWMFEWDLWNGITLCDKCHKKEHKTNGFSLGFITKESTKIRKSLNNRGINLYADIEWQWNPNESMLKSYMRSQFYKNNIGNGFNWYKNYNEQNIME